MGSLEGCFTSAVHGREEEGQRDFRSYEGRISILRIVSNDLYVGIRASIMFHANCAASL